MWAREDIPTIREWYKRQAQCLRLYMRMYSTKLLRNKGLISSPRATCLESFFFVCAGMLLENCSIPGPGFSCSMTWGCRKGSCTAGWLSPLLCLPGADKGKAVPLTPSSVNLCWQVVTTHQGLAPSMQVHAARRLSSPALMENALPGFSRRGQADGEQSPCSHQWAPAGSPGQAVSRAGLQLTRTWLEPETPSCLLVLNSALVWNRKAFAVGCHLPKMDQRLDNSCLASFALGDTTMYSWKSFGHAV